MSAAKTLYFILLLIGLVTLEMRGQSLSGSGTVGDPYQIYDADDLNDIRNYSPNGKLFFKLMNDIDLSSYSNWESIGGNNTSGAYPDAMFRNYLDGGGYTISNLTQTSFTHHGEYYTGLFGGIGGQSSPDSSNIQNVIIKNANINITIGNASLDYYCGLIAGYGGFKQTHPQTKNVILKDNKVNITVGDVNVFYYGSGIGQLECYAYQIASVNDSIHITTGTIASGTDASRGIGGIIGGTSGFGRVEQSIFKSRLITNSEHGTSGAIIGISNNNEINQNNYAQGKIISNETSSERYLGGILGYTQASASNFEKCYTALDSVYTTPSNANAGLVIGYNTNTDVTLTDIFVDTELPNTSKILGHDGGESTAGIGKTTAEMKTQSTFTNWDFVNIWEMESGGYPKLRWFIETPPKSISIILPAENTLYSLNDSIYVKYSTLNIDTVTVNGDTVANDSLYTLLANNVGNFPIAVKELNGIVKDSINVKVIGDTQLTIDTASVLNRVATITCTNSLHLDSLRFYVGLDTNNMQYLGKGAIVSLSQDYSFPLPNNFYVSGNYWYKVLRDVDTSTSIKNDGEIRFMGMPKSPSGICWYNKDRSFIGIDRLYDAGCGWVNNITYRYYDYLLRTDLVNTTDSLFWKYRYKSCTIEERQDPAINIYCNNAAIDYKVFIKDTVHASIDSAVVLHLNEFNEAAPFEYGNRRFYLHNNIIYADDLVHNIDSIVVKSFDKDYLKQEPVTMSILRYEVPENNDTLKTDGTLAGRRRALTKLKHPFFILTQENNGWSYYADVPDTTYSLIQDKYQATGKVNFYRSQFRGVHPKATKTAVPPYNNFGN